MASRGTWLSTVVLLYALVLAGCAVVESSEGKMGTGVAYSLPKGQVSFTAERTFITPVDVEKARKAAAEAAALVTADKTLLKDAKEKLKTDEGILANATGDAIADAKKAVDKDRALVKFLTDVVSVDQKLAELLKAKAEAAAKGVGELRETAVIAVLPVVPDSNRSARFVANLKHFVTRDDNLKLGVANGMLASSEMVSTDRTGDIAVKLVQIASLFAGTPIPSVGPEVKGTEAIAPPPACPPYHVSGIFDPVDLREVSALTTALSEKKSSFTLAISPDPLPADSLNQPPLAKDKKEPATDGLYYRSPISVTISTKVNQAQVDTCDLKTFPAPQSLVAVVPDTSQNFLVPMTGGAFVTTTQAATFKDGMITSYSADKPSELLAALDIPIRIAKAPFSILTEFLQLKVDYNNTEAAAINAKVAEMKAQIEAIQQERALDAARNGVLPPDPTSE